MHVLSVVGARPQFVKLAPVARAASRAGVDHTIVHTGQHYDELLSDVFFSEFGIPDPDVHLGVGSGMHGAQTGEMIAALERELDRLRPDWVLVYGDTNSTLAAAVAAVKLHLPIAHLEAGLRSFNRKMPEEHNRVLTDHASDLLLAPTARALEHLEREGLAGRTVVVGDVMTDILRLTQEATGRAGSGTLDRLDVATGEYFVATIHRAENTDDHGRLGAILNALSRIDRRVLLIAHPRLRHKAQAGGLALEQGNVRVHDPLSYTQLVEIVSHARGVITDSGGLQKEAFVLRVPTTTVRAETEWTETLEGGWNVLAPDASRIVEAVNRVPPSPTHSQPYGDGHASDRVMEQLHAHHVARRTT